MMEAFEACVGLESIFIRLGYIRIYCHENSFINFLYWLGEKQDLSCFLSLEISNLLMTSAWRPDPQFDDLSTNVKVAPTPCKFCKLVGLLSSEHEVPLYRDVLFVGHLSHGNSDTSYISRRANPNSPLRVKNVHASGLYNSSMAKK